MRELITLSANQTEVLQNDSDFLCKLTGHSNCICKSALVLGIGQENHYRLSEGLNRLIIDCTIENYVHFSIKSNIHKRNILHICKQT